MLLRWWSPDQLYSKGLCLESPPLLVSASDRRVIYSARPLSVESLAKYLSR